MANAAKADQALHSTEEDIKSDEALLKKFNELELHQLCNGNYIQVTVSYGFLEELAQHDENYKEVDLLNLATDELKAGDVLVWHKKDNPDGQFAHSAIVTEGMPKQISSTGSDNSPSPTHYILTCVNSSSFPQVPVGVEKW